MPDTERRATKQRRAVEQVLRETDDFISAQALHARLREQGDTVGLATVYRTLNAMAEDELLPLLRELYQWQTRAEFVHRRAWEPGMLVMWDNRAVLHRATGGYEGHRRELHRTTIAAHA